MRRIAIGFTLGFVALGFGMPVRAQSMVPIGKGCTTAFYIDWDCDGYGPGVRSSGVYGYQTPGVGNKPDADDSDASINTPATVLTAYDANGNATLDNPELKKFLLERKGITADNIYYISLTGNNSTGAPDSPTQPLRLLQWQSLHVPWRRRCDHLQRRYLCRSKYGRRGAGPQKRQCGKADRHHVDARGGRRLSDQRRLYLRYRWKCLDHH